MPRLQCRDAVKMKRCCPTAISAAACRCSTQHTCLKQIRAKLRHAATVKAPGHSGAPPYQFELGEGPIAPPRDVKRPSAVVCHCFSLRGPRAACRPMGNIAWQKPGPKDLGITDCAIVCASGALSQSLGAVYKMMWGGQLSPSDLLKDLAGGAYANDVVSRCDVSHASRVWSAAQCLSRQRRALGPAVRLQYEAAA